jgi:hypothetical protein
VNSAKEPCELERGEKYADQCEFFEGQVEHWLIVTAKTALPRMIDRCLLCCILLFRLLMGEVIIKKTLGITVAVVIGGCVVLITIVLVLQVLLSLLAAG